MIRNISKRSGESAFSVSSCYWNISSTQNSQGFKNFSSSCILSSLVPSNSGRPVEDVLPSTFSEKNLFRHCKHPRTASIIGYVYSYWSYCVHYNHYQFDCIESIYMLPGRRCHLHQKRASTLCFYKTNLSRIYNNLFLMKSTDVVWSAFRWNCKWVDRVEFCCFA